jgi:ubiquinone/menaquinone biosynthesis C-methylase UbiE
VAARYDADFTETPLGRRQREIVHRYVQGIVQPHHRVLELNCGTGEDALWLAERAGEVVATDISERMLNVARTKADRHGAGASLSFRRLDLNQLRSDDIASQLGGFDLIVSNFDGLNCLRDIDWLPAALARLLNPGGQIALVFMNPVCAMEILSCLVTARPRRAFMRFQPTGASAHIGNDERVQTFFHPVGRVVRSLRAEYTVRRIEAVGLITPPTLMRSFYHRHLRWFAKLHRLEDLLSPLPPFNRLGDHVLIHARLRKL